MRKRIGSKIYDTDTAELICAIDGGLLYQKRTRGREWFAVMDDGTVRPLDVYDPRDMALMETGHMPPETFDEPEVIGDKIRVDPETYQRIAAAAKAEGVSMPVIIRRLAQDL